jgi:hypothetical protein
MNPLLIAPLIELGGSIINRLFPDPQQKAAAELELLKMTQEGDLKQILAQLEINAKEAAHPSIFVAGWRPFVGWTCGIGFLYATIVHNLIGWIATAKGWPMPPTIDSELLIYVLGGMLGIGGLRTYEKVKRVTK